MTHTRFAWSDPGDIIAEAAFASNSFGRQDATLTAAQDADPEKLSELSLALSRHGMTAYPDIQDGKPVLTVYGFGKPEKLAAALKAEGFTCSNATTTFTDNSSKKGLARKFVQRYSLQMAAASGLAGHASMYYLAALTGNRHFYGTAASYTAADAVIAAYGTDKAVTADPVMQDFKRYLWEQGVENDFVNADTSKVSSLQSGHQFMKKYSFQAANALGGYGNVKMMMGALSRSQKDWGTFTAGATSLAGAGLQIFGTEDKFDWDDAKRKGIPANVVNFVNGYPMQIAGLTNFSDPIVLTASALMANQRNQRTIVENTRSIHEAKESLVALAKEDGLTPKSLPKGLSAAIESERPILTRIGEIQGQIEKAEGKVIKGWGPIGKIAGAVREIRGPQTDELKALHKELRAQEKLITNNSKLIGESAIDLHSLFKGKHLGEAAKITANIQNWQNEINMAVRGGKKEPYVRGAVALFYGGATMLRLISRKTATADQNRDAFNEVYAAAAQSLLNIDDPAQRESMLTQMGHYLSTHEKMKEPAEVILEKIRERVETFEQNPFSGYFKQGVSKPANDDHPPQPNAEQIASEGRVAEKEQHVAAG